MTHTAATVTAASTVTVSDLTTDQKVTVALKARAFGVEIETVGATRTVLANAIAKVFPGSTVSKGTDWYASIYVTMPDGRVWRLMSDGSLTGRSRGSRPTFSEKCAEVVSPILTWADMDQLQEVVRVIRRAGATVDASCGIHVHVDARDLTVKQVANLVTDVSNNEGMFDEMLGIANNRRHQWCKPLPMEKAARITALRETEEAAKVARESKALADVWYGGSYESRTKHYNSTRYHGLNLHALYTKGTVEFRWFQPSLHAGEVKAYVVLALAMVGRAVVVSTVKPGTGWTVFGTVNAAGAVRRFFNHHGLHGAEFANTRLHLRARVTGDTVAPDAEALPVRRVRAARPVATPAGFVSATTVTANA